MPRTLKQEIADGNVQDQRGQLPGFEKPITSKLVKSLPEKEKQVLNEKAKATRLARKEADEKQAQFQKLKETLKKEGKL